MHALIFLDLFNLYAMNWDSFWPIFVNWKKKSNQCSEVRMSTMLWMVSISDDNKQTNEVRLVKKRGLTMHSVTYSPRQIQPGMEPSTICGAYSSMWWLIESDVMWIKKKTGYTVYIILVVPDKWYIVFFYVSGDWRCIKRLLLFLFLYGISMK